MVRDLDLLETRAESELRRGGARRSNRSSYNDDDDDFAPSNAGTGGFFDT